MCLRALKVQLRNNYLSGPQFPLYQITGKRIFLLLQLILADIFTNAMLEVLVIGGGLAGLSSAIGLARSGHRVTLLEAQHEFSEVIHQLRNWYCLN